MSTALAQPAACRPHSQFQRPTILCIDDDPDVTWTIEVRLKAYDVTVKRAFHGMQGIWEVARARPDLIIMDLAMPRGDGSYILRCLRSKSETYVVPIIVLTGLRDPALASRMIREGANAFLHKPLAFDDLLHNMSRFVDLRRVDDESSDDQIQDG
jgi:DNA-binding response OmpR family regulator